jgi:hypothetical protein
MFVFLEDAAIAANENWNLAPLFYAPHRNLNSCKINSVKEPESVLLRLVSVSIWWHLFKRGSIMGLGTN